MMNLVNLFTSQELNGATSAWTSIRPCRGTSDHLQWRKWSTWLG